MDLIEKIIPENHRYEFSATSGRPNISLSPLRLTSGHFPEVIPATEKKIQRDSVLCLPVKEIPEAKSIPEPTGIGNVIEEVVYLTRQMNLEVDSYDVQERLDSLNHVLTMTNSTVTERPPLERTLLLL
ncbi:hypothetical protein TNCV_2853351 [Trichonephila clavipes]|uniref:Uncharacterized protein n=1 Tax=Trichonephila clavipes TaxID=2585209 RepID=A0A8X6R7P0_TRICX|nr:hypothetical protein TNCV_2853351 [Trichonephila clavipes]